MITDSYLAPVWEKELAFEESGDLIFSTPAVRKPNIGRLPVPPKLSAVQVNELGKKLEAAGQVGLGWLR